MARVQHDHALLVCGDFNVRIGSLGTVAHTAVGTSRSSRDPKVCARGRWLVDQVGIWGCHLLNGSLGDTSGAATCVRSNGCSVVDYMCVRGCALDFSVIADLAGGLSDHLPLVCKLNVHPAM